LYFIERNDNALQDLRKELLEQIITSELEAMSDPVITKEKEKSKIRKSEVDLDSLWSEKECAALKSFELHHSCRGFSCQNCGNQKHQIVNCLDCNGLFCGNCDEHKHSSNPFHERVFFSKTRPGKQLLPTEYIDEQGKIFFKRVGLPLSATKCDKCETIMSQNSSSETHAVITPKGLLSI
jgi:hypothetical protein